MKKHELTSARSITVDMGKLLNEQIHIEAAAASLYLAMSSWAETKGYEGAAKFLHTHAEEERKHMMRIFRYVNEAGGAAIVPTLKPVPATYASLRTVFEQVLSHELFVSKAINKIVEACLGCGDYTTYQFLTWFLTEQREEETMARQALALFDKLEKAPTGLYLVDKTLSKMHAE